MNGGGKSGDDYLLKDNYFNKKDRIDLRKKEIEEYNEKRKNRLKSKESNSAIDIISRLTNAQSVADLSTEEMSELYDQLRNVNTAYGL